MRPLRRPVLAVLLLLPLAAGAWLYGTPAGQRWRLARLSTADLLAWTLAHPQDGPAQALLGNRLLAEGKPQEAADAFAAQAAAEPQSVQARIAQGRALIRAGAPAEALAPLEAALRLPAGSADAHAALGEAYYALDNRTLAQTQFETALRNDPSSLAAQAGMAFVAADQHQLDTARAAAERAVQIAPDSSLACTAQGYVADQSGDSDAAIRALTRAVTLDAADGRAWSLLAAVTTRTAQTADGFARAEQALTQAEALLPQSPLVPYYRGQLRMKQARYEEAIAQFQRALARSPGFTDALYNLSVAQAFAGQKAESARTRAQFERAQDYSREITNLQLRIGRDPSQAALWRRMQQLAAAYGDAGRERLATTRLQRLRESRPATSPASRR
jgi:tetratricopeptide (TPR) repeat protein